MGAGPAGWGGWLECEPERGRRSVVLAGLLLNTGLVLSAVAGAAGGPAPLAARALVWAGAAAGLAWAKGLFSLAQLDKKLGSYKTKAKK